ncbi:hypothetical protein POM88_006330 [Heracleum sosnowskyi]|uniref:Longin domain-containing protein n=1 Tax=Heracleum sosnowskyi TaxID=360622 RepID=A0AAD8N571_9APIA|nr:hypothetical protein POM88_006330 [Heracleum sosnowskyi]
MKDKLQMQIELRALISTSLLHQVNLGSTSLSDPPSSTGTSGIKLKRMQDICYQWAYCVVAKDTVGKQISIAFLERVAADFKKIYGGAKAGTAVAKSLNKEFGPLMKQHMQYIIDHADEIDKLIKVKAQVSEVKRMYMWYQNMKIKLVVFGIVLLLVLIIWLSVCHGFNCSN